MKKVYKVILIILFYVLMFWGLINGIKALLPKNSKCTCYYNRYDDAIPVSKEIVQIQEENIDIINENKKKEEIPKKETPKKETPKKEKTNNQKEVSTITGTKEEYQSYAYDLVLNSYLWSEEDYEALVNLWTKESNWDANAHNKSSGAHGIPQSLPATKMSSEASDYYTNGYTQIRWGLKYIKERYGTPSAAWEHFKNKNWY